MKRLRLIAAIALLLALLPAGLVSASRRIEVSGTRSFAGGKTVIEDWRTVGDTCVGVLQWPIKLKGTIEAECILQLRIVEHDACPNDPHQHRENWGWYGACTGTVAGQQGSFTFDGVGVERPQPIPHHRAQVVLSGTGNLETLHGVVQFWGSPEEGANYDGFVVFAGRP
jgi:hypothetical protein